MKAKTSKPFSFFKVIKLKTGTILYKCNLCSHIISGRNGKGPIINHLILYHKIDYKKLKKFINIY